MDEHPDQPGSAPAPPERPREPPPALPAAPRPVSGRIRRRAWRERHVWIWLVLGAALLGISLYYAASRTWWWWREKRLIETGQRIEAEIKGWYPGEDSLPNKLPPPGVNMVDIVYDIGGRSYRPQLSLAGRSREQSATGSKVTIFVDRDDPQRWTARQEPASLRRELLGAMILLPGAIVLLVVAWLRRGQVLRIYREGNAVLAEVVAIGQTPTAPLSRLIRCVMREGDASGATIIKTVLPGHRNTQPGDLIWLLTPPGRSDPAIAAAVFE